MGFIQYYQITSQPFNQPISIFLLLCELNFIHHTSPRYTTPTTPHMTTAHRATPSLPPPHKWPHHTALHHHTHHPTHDHTSPSSTTYPPPYTWPQCAVLHHVPTTPHMTAPHRATPHTHHLAHDHTTSCSTTYIPLHTWPHHTALHHTPTTPHMTTPHRATPHLAQTWGCILSTSTGHLLPSAPHDGAINSWDNGSLAWWITLHSLTSPDCRGTWVIGDLCRPRACARHANRSTLIPTMAQVCVRDLTYRDNWVRLSSLYSGLSIVWCWCADLAIIYLKEVIYILIVACSIFAFATAC